MKLALQLARRFRTAKQSNGYISFISMSSTLGIGLGCFVLILLLSVMNGFEKELKERLLSVLPHGELFAVSPAGIEDWSQHLQRLAQDPRVKHVQPYIKATGMLQKGSEMKALEVTALAADFAKGDKLLQQIPAAHWHSFEHNPNALILGKGVMRQLNLHVGDKVQLLLPSSSEDLNFNAPKSLWLEVAGNLSVGGELDNHIAVMHLSQAAQVLGVSHGAQGLRFHFDDPFNAYSLMREIGYAFPQYVYISDWTRTQGHLYQDIQLVRTVVYIALTLVIAVACFNIVSTLVMAVKEKQAEIAMLKTMGASDQLIKRVFVLQGLLNGISGTLIGSVIGIIVATYLTQIANALESITGITFLSGDIYFIDFLPSVLHWQDVIITMSIAMLLSLLATLYPAKQAAAINPAQALGG